MDRTDLEKMIISNIRRLRLEKKMTQEELAIKANFQTGYIGGIETGDRFPKVENLNRIAIALGVDLGYLVSPKAYQIALKAAGNMENIKNFLQDYLTDQKLPIYPS